MIYTTGSVSVAGNTVTGTGTNFSAAGSLIRVGCTLVTLANPVQVFQITAINSATQLTVTPAATPAIAAGTAYAILLSDSLSVDGLALNVSEVYKIFQQNMTGFVDVMNGAGDVVITINGVAVTVPGQKSLAKKGANSDITSLSGLTTALSIAQGGTGAKTATDARAALGLKGASVLDVGTVAGTVAAGNDSRIAGALQASGGYVDSSLALNSPYSYFTNTAAARYAQGPITYIDIFRFSQVDIGGVGTQGNLQFVANPGNWLSFELVPGNGSHSFRHDGKIVTNGGTVAFVSSDGRIKNKRGKPKGSAQDRIRALAGTATQDYLWLNYQGDFNTYRYEQPQRGFIAQDAYAIDPTYASKPQNGADDAMPENGDAIWGVNTNAIVADLVIAVDEQQTDIEGLRKTVADQQALIADLTARIAALEGKKSEDPTTV